MKRKVSELEGEELDKAVMRAEETFNCADFSTRWADGGPIIEREGIWLQKTTPLWRASVGDMGFSTWGETALVAAMRAYVHSKFGDYVEIA